MTTIKNSLNDLNDEIENLLKFEMTLESGHIPLPAEIKNTQLTTSIKSSLMIMLYNAVESTVTKCLSRIHQQINSENIVYSDLSEPVQKIYLTYYDKSINKCREDKVIKWKFELINLFSNIDKINIPFDHITKSYSLYSGNLDSKVIKQVLSKYGIETSIKEPFLQIIKTNRNKLAHGESSFEEIGRQLTYQQLEKIKKETMRYLESFISEIDKFISNQMYKRNVSYPSVTDGV